MDHVDLYGEHRTLFGPPTLPVKVKVSAASYLAVDGTGDPNSAQFSRAMEALYSAAFTLKFALKREGRMEFRIMPLEGLFWSGKPALPRAAARGGPVRGTSARSAAQGAPTRARDWHWTAMIMIPKGVRDSDLEAALAEMERKRLGRDAMPAVRLEQLREGLCAQVMHVGPYADESPTIAALRAFIKAEGCRPVGKHHEIYLSDPRRTPAAKMKTVIRQPMVPVSPRPPAARPAARSQALKTHRR